MFERSRYAVDLIAPEIFAAIQLENWRSEDHIEQVASEKHISPAVMAVQSAQLISKYSAGYPGKR